jgi:hypothetical protein
MQLLILFDEWNKTLLHFSNNNELMYHDVNVYAKPVHFNLPFKQTLLRRDEWYTLKNMCKICFVNNIVAVL